MTDFGSFILGGLETLKAAILGNNVRANRIRSAGNTAALVHEVRESAETTDETILAYRAKFQQAQERILAWQAEIDKYIVENGLVETGSVDVEAETEAWKKDAATIKNLRKVLEGLPGGADALAAAELPDVVGIPGARSGGGGSTGVRRPRFSLVEYTVAGSDDWKRAEKTEGEGEDAVVKSNLTILATILGTKDHKVTASDLQGPLFDAAGTNDLSTLNGTPVEFAFSVGDVNYMVRATPTVSE